ncbi:MAG: pilus assembly protein [Burkholderiaceae bacterium]
MRINTSRFKLAFKAMTIHFGLSLLVAAVVALLVFTLWFPYPYRELAGGRELFILVMAVDIVCGPLLTFVLFSPTKPKKELITDISLIAVIQILALCYGIWTVWQVRPLFLVQEADRFNIISTANIETKDLELLPANLRPSLFSGPIKVSLRDMSPLEREKLNAQIKSGEKDASQLPIYYANYQGIKAYQNGHELRELLIVHPEHKDTITSLMKKSNGDDRNKMRYLYIAGRYYWIVIVNQRGDFVTYLENK